jgi:branched-chain amino acid transport system permease protein
VLVFLFMAVVLAVRPTGLFGRVEAAHPAPRSALPIRPLGRSGRLLAALLAAALVAAPLAVGDYWLALLSEIAIWALLAASLQFLTGLGGMVSFGHAAWFGIGAYAAALLVKKLGLGMLPALAAAPLAAAAGAALFALLAGHLRGVYFAMMSLAFAQICFAVAFQWGALTGGDNGLLGIWPPDWASSAAGFWWLTLALAGFGLLLLRHAAHAPLGAALRATRDAPLGAAAIGIHVRRQQAFGLALAGAAAGLAGGLHVFLKGSLFPTELGIPVSVDALVIVLLGGIETLGGPLAGAFVYKSVQIGLATATDHWRGLLGLGIVGCVMLMPQGLVGTWQRFRLARA